MTATSPLSQPETPPRPPGASAQVRIAVFYATVFTVLGVFTAFGAIWFAEQGIAESRIGIISAVPVAILLMTNLWVGRIADRAPDWRQAIVGLFWVSALGSLGLFLGGGFWPILLFWTLLSVAQGLAIPITDAAAIRLARREDFDYPGVRAWGTVGYIGSIFLAGLAVAAFGPAAYVPLVVAMTVLRAATTHWLPRFRAAPGAESSAGGARHLRDVLKPWFVLPLVGWSMVFGTFLVLNTFQALLWKQQGIGPGWITFLIALAPAAETAMFFQFRRLARRFRARHLILASGVLAIFRWLCFAASPGVFWLIPLQLMHAFTFAMGFMGCVAFIANWTSEDIAAEAQSFFYVLQQLFAVITLTGFGWLTERYGAHAYYASALFSLAGVALIALSLKLQEAPAPKPSA